jgi:oligosaccharide 4-alpha-D-glucosyltransferase
MILRLFCLLATGCVVGLSTVKGDSLNKDFGLSVTDTSSIDQKFKNDRGSKNGYGHLVGYASHSFENGVLRVRDLNGVELEILPYDQDIIKVSLLKEGRSLADTSHAVVMKPKVDLGFELNETLEFLELKSGNSGVKVQKNPVRLTVLRNGKELLNHDSGIFWKADTVGVRFALAKKEALYGTGSRALPFNLRGKKLDIYNNAHYGYTEGDSLLNITIPFVLSSQKYGILVDNHFPGVVDLGMKEENVMEYFSEAGELRYYVFLGDTFSQIMSGYTQLTGNQPLPPRWALGYIQSRFGYETEQEAREMVQKLKDADFPLDGLVLDLYWFGDMQDMGNLDWDREKWPNAEKMVADFKEQGVKTILITETYVTKESKNFEEVKGKGLLTTDEHGEPFIMEKFWAGAAGLIDILKPEAQEWMWPYYKARIEEGIEGWWCDLGEPEKHPEEMRHLDNTATAREVHNIYSLVWGRMLYDNYREHYPNKRLFNLIRSGWAGSQRYSAFPWSGDIQRSFEGMRTQVPLMLNSGLSSIAYMHSDLGGFTDGDEDAELYARWLQFGAFTPIMRAHGHGVPAEPVLYDSLTQNIVRDFIKLRYQLTPYNYTLAWENSQTGIPLARPLFFVDGEDEKLFEIDDQYLWGDAFLIAPAIVKGQTSREVYLPQGKWIDFWTQNQYVGGQNYTFDMPIQRMPILVKAGSIVPMVKTFSSLDFYKTDSLAVHFYADKEVTSSSFTMYDDDGEAYGADRNGNHELITYSSAWSRNNLDFVVNRSGNGYEGMPNNRNITLQVHGVTRVPRRIRVGGKRVKISQSQEQFERAASPSAYHDQEKLFLLVKYDVGGKDAKVSLRRVEVGEKR